MRNVFGSALTVVFLAACGPDAMLRDADELGAKQSGLIIPQEVKLHFVFLHGVQWNDEGRYNAGESLRSLEEELKRKIDLRLPQYHFEHPDAHLTFQTYRLGLYTDGNGNLRPSLDDPSDGSGVPSADRWRASLSEGLTRILPADAQNVILIGHSTGGRVAMEVAANVGGAGAVGAHDWGWQSRIVGVVTVDGMIDALNSPTYDFLAAWSYVSGCKLVQGDGWCEYSGHISAVPATDWVARNKRALTLISAGRCSPSTWTGESDQALPLRSQSSPWASGLTMTRYPGETYGPASGYRYGPFCHTDITNTGSGAHLAAREEVSNRILAWLFDAAPRVASSYQVNIPALPPNQWSASYSFGISCGVGSDVGGEIAAMGTCSHPGRFDGGDHPFDAADLDIVRTGPCRATVRWRHLDSGLHAARLNVKLHSQPSGGGMISTLNQKKEAMAGLR
ncbi:MAG: alpha/beta fold hydrolase [Myxococcaceae bacterium]